MGRSSTFRCATCKKLYYLGYGSYNSWLDYVNNEDEYNKNAKNLILKKPEFTKLLELTININVLKCLREHKGHDFTFVNEDWSVGDITNNDEWEDYPEDFEYIDLES